MVNEEVGSIEATDMGQFYRKAKIKSDTGKIPKTYAYMVADLGTQRSDLLLEYRNSGVDTVDLCFYLLKTYKSTFLAPPKKAPEVPTKN